MHTNIRATREGLQGQKTSTGYLIDALVPFVALPSAAALRQWVTVTYQGRSVRALVLDVGPWNVNDNAYVFGGERPASERGLDVSHNGKTNGAGIDLGEAVRVALGIPDGVDNVGVDWEFA